LLLASIKGRREHLRGEGALCTFGGQGRKGRVFQQAGIWEGERGWANGGRNSIEKKSLPILLIKGRRKEKGEASLPS